MTASERAKEYRAKNPHKAAEDAKAWRAKHPNHSAEYSRAYYLRNKESEKSRTSAYRKANLEKYRQLERNRTPLKVAKNALRRAKKLQATPSWLTEEQLKQMNDFYKACPNGYEVDHVVPLVSSVVCGLHVPWNLQYLTSLQNRIKGNKL